MASVTVWLGQLDSSQDEMLRRIHARYWPQLVAAAARRLPSGQRRTADDEDLAQEAFIAFCQRVRHGGELVLGGRQDLLALLTAIIKYKAINLYHHDKAQIRGGGEVQSMPVDSDGRILEAADEQALSPEEEVAMAEEYNRYVGALPDTLRPVAEMYLSGHNAASIAESQGYVKRTAERRISRICEIWRELGQADLQADVVVERRT